MESEIKWEGHNIEIYSQPSLKYLWIAAETVVKVDEIEVGRSKGFGRSGGWGGYEKVDGNFIHNGVPTKFVLEIKVDLITLVSVPYKFYVEDVVISQGRLKIKNWQLFFVPVFVFICICCLAITFFIFFSANNTPDDNSVNALHLYKIIVSQLHSS